MHSTNQYRQNNQNLPEERVMTPDKQTPDTTEITDGEEYIIILFCKEVYNKRL